MNNDDSMRIGFVRRRLPWIIAAAFFALYLLTLNHWVSWESMASVSKVTGWDWSPQVKNPLLYLVTGPIQWFPVRFQPILLNALGALLGALTLGQLARSVALLPHDRTREQRQRERSDYSLLSLKAAWMPPLFACLLCGFQWTFWEESTAFVGEILSVFVFACVLRCLLEFRLYQEDRWLYRMALLYGFAIPSDWAFIGYFPLAVCALIWMKGVPSFRPEFMGRMMGLGAVGLSTYFLLPLLIWMQDSSAGSFVELLKLQFLDAKLYLISMPKTGVLLESLFWALPLLVMGIRFPSSIGDVSIVGSMLANFLFRLMHLVFLGTCVWMAFDPLLRPKNSDPLLSALPIEFLTFSYLGALAVGYFSGYALLVFRDKPSRSHRKASRETRFLNVAVSGLLWLGVLGSSAGLLIQNGTDIWRNNKSDLLPDFAALLVRNLPETETIVLADNAEPILLVQSELARSGRDRRYAFIDTHLLQTEFYERQVRESLKTKFPEVFADDGLPERLNKLSLLSVLADVKKKGDYPVYYLHHSFGLYFEVFYPSQKGLVTELLAYSEGQVEPPPLPAEDFESNQAFWNEVDDKRSAATGSQSPTHRRLGAWHSREQNVWAVSLQRAGRLEEAKAAFQRSLIWNPENLCAKVNLRQNKILRGEADAEPAVFTSSENQSIQKNYGSGEQRHERLMLANGPVDTPEFCRLLAVKFSQGGQWANHRQAMLQYKRASVLDPSNVETKLLYAESLWVAGFPEESLKQIESIRAENLHLSPAQKTGLVRLEAWGHYEMGNKAAMAGDEARQAASFKTVEEILQSALADDRNNEVYLDTLFRFYMFTEQNEEALRLLDRHLAISPNASYLLQNKAVVHMQMGQYAEAVELSNQVIEAAPKNFDARLNRAISRYRMGDHENAKRDYEAVAEALPDHHAVHYGLGQIAKAAGDASTAVSHFERYLELAPSETNQHREVRKALAELKGQ